MMNDEYIMLDLYNTSAQSKAEQITYLSDKLTELSSEKEISFKQLVYEIDNIGLLLTDCASDLTEYIGNCEDIIHNLQKSEE
jgi:hypothetical protein